MNNKKVWGTILGVAAFIALVAGVTYAWFTWSSNNTIINGTTGCFNIVYDKGTDVTGTLIPSADYTGGINAKVKINISEDCDITGTGTLYLNTQDATTVPLTGAVKYEVYQGSTRLDGGTITAKGDKAILSNFELSKAATATTEYTVYVWIDGDLANNDYAGTSYVGYIHASATQTES